MITFIISLIALVVGFVLYGTFVERVFGIDSNAQTPAISKADVRRYNKKCTCASKRTLSCGR